MVVSRGHRGYGLQILLHPSDVVVSSIVCNPSIEAVVVPPVKTRLLTFEAMPPDKVREHLNAVRVPGVCLARLTRTLVPWPRLGVGTGCPAWSTRS